MLLVMGFLSQTSLDRLHRLGGHGSTTANTGKRSSFADSDG